MPKKRKIKKTKTPKKPRPWYKRAPAVFTLGLVSFVVVFAVVHLTKRPQMDRDWIPYAEVIPHADIEEDQITIHNFRDFRWESGPGLKIKEQNYLTKTVDLSKFKGVWFIKEDFSYYDGFAHTFLSFEFEGGDYVCISVEARREVGEEYTGWQGLWQKYELMFIAGTEKDFIGRRLFIQDADVFLYPVKISRENGRDLFVSMVEKMNELRQDPEFYNTLFSNCTNNLYRHAELTTGIRIPIRWNTVLTGYTDKAGYKMGIIPNDLPFYENRMHYKIDPDTTSLEDPEFSETIREGKRLKHVGEAGG